VSPLLLLLIALGGVADEASYPGPLKEYLAAKHKDGTPALDAGDHKALAAMSEHTRKLIADAADSMILGSADHLKILLSLGLSAGQLELVMQDNCVLCHTDPGNQKPANLFAVDPGAHGSNPLLHLKQFVSDVHFKRGLSCAGCHGGKPTDDTMTKEIAARWPSADERHKDRSWIPAFCGRCHADPAFMRGFNPALPTDQLAKYKTSVHGVRLLDEKDARPAQCVSCHGVHGILSAKSPQSKVHPQRIPETCGACHADPQHMAGFKTAAGDPMPTDQLEQYKRSVHGKALLGKGELSAPSCASCHGSHAAMPVAKAAVVQVCRQCHAQNGTLFDGSQHKKAFEAHGWPECAQCHGRHAIDKPVDALIGDAPGTLCHDCHARYSKDNPECSATAVKFRTALDTLAAGQREAQGQVEWLAERGLDTEPLTRAIGDLDEALVQTRSKVHAFSAAPFQESAAVGTEALAKARALIEAAHVEHRFRTRGLTIAIAFMGLLALGLWLKLRRIERARPPSR
jgi:hypothetical protein